MEFYSTKNKNVRIGLKEAVYKGLSEDGGLFLPVNIPVFHVDFINNIHQLNQHEIFFEVAKKWIGKDLKDEVIQKIIKRVFSFDIPIVNLHDNIFALELFHGPTMAFKDVGAAFMANLISHFRKDESKEINIIVATSGDTGSAVASGFFDVPGINVFILYPKGKVSPLQEKQLTTWGKNIKAIEVNGTFDDCQALVKQLLSDKKLNKSIKMSSANSINIARLIPQTFYYFSSYADLKLFGNSFAYAIPSGNFGNLTGGILAKKMGLPIDYFIASTNINNIVPNYLLSGDFKPKPSFETISNAMDVGNPSNFERLTDLFSNYKEMNQLIKGAYFSDKQTIEAIKTIENQFDYLLDPHGAVGYLGLQQWMKTLRVEVGIFLETAHPAKFAGVLEKNLQKSIEIPDKLRVFEQKQKNAIPIENDYNEVIQIIHDNI